MTNKRPYIDCPLWAAIAAKYHGINFWDPDTDCEVDIKEIIEWAYRGEDLMKFYIHPNSYEKLQHQVGDIIFQESSGSLYAHKFIHDDQKFPRNFMPLGGGGGPSNIGQITGNVYIIQRNGIPFPPIKWEDVE